MSDECCAARRSPKSGALITHHSLLITFLALLLTLPLAAQIPNSTATQIKKFKFVPPTIKKGGEIHWQVAEGGRQEVVRDEYAILEKEVRIDYQDIKMQADKVTVNLKTKDVVAEGHVVVDQGASRVTADHTVFNLDTKTGTFFKATAAMEPAMYFTGDKLEKVDEDTYHMVHGVITSCDLDNPSWSFRVGDATIRLDDYAHMSDVEIRAHRLPLFWLPKLVWPTKKDRAQGFLIPRILFSNTFGTRLELGYFIPIGDSVDTTIYADLNTKNYTGIGVNVRYLPSENVKIGELSAYTVHNPQTDLLQTGEPARQEWRYEYKHAQDNLPGGFRGVVDVQDFSNLDFFRRYDRDPRLHTISNIYSSAYLTKNTSTYSLNLITDRRDIFLGTFANNGTGAEQRQRFEQLPSLQFRMYPQRLLGSSLYFSLESSASHLITTGLLTGPNANYYRADFFPTLSLQLHTPPWFSVRPQISLRETYYSQQLDDQSVANPFGNLTATNQGLNRFYAQGQVEMVGPSFSRVFNEQIGSFTKFKHVIEPRIRYVYTTDVPEQNRIIRFDTVDSPFLPLVQDSVEYSLTQRIIGREKDPSSSPREVLSFALRQSVSLSKPFSNATGGNLPGSTATPLGKFTPLVASLHVNPYQSITFDANATYGNVSHQIDQTSVSANLVGTGTRADKYLSFTLFSIFSAPIPGTTQQTPGSSQIRLNTGSSILNDRIHADVQLNYDATKGQFLEQRYLIGGNASCWGLTGEFRRYLVFGVTQKAITSYGIAVTLKNVGTIGTH
jgi:LPS-assembly protein